VEGKIDMAARRQVTNKLRAQYRKASKADKGKILDGASLCQEPGARSVVWWLLVGPGSDLSEEPACGGFSWPRWTLEPPPSVLPGLPHVGPCRGSVVGRPRRRGAVLDHVGEAPF
jgi:hypothetical protein